MAQLIPVDKDDPESGTNCSNCDAWMLLVIDNPKLTFNYVEYCPFCGDEIEETDDANE